MWDDDSPVLKVSLRLRVENWMKNSLTSLEQRSERSSPCYIVSVWFLTIDPFIKNIRLHRKAFRAIRLLAYPRGLSLSRIYPIL